MILDIRLLKKKSEELRINNSDQFKILDEVQIFISKEIKTNIRELTGALNRIVSYSRIYNKTASLSEAKIILRDLL